MGVPTLLDAVILAPAAILALLGLWFGLGRSLVAWPMRWLIPLLGACGAAAPAMLYLDPNGATADLLSLSGTAVATLFGAIAFLVTFALLVMFMRNLRERMTVWTRARRIGLPERVYGGVFGIACGLLLVAVPLGLQEAIWPDGTAGRSWARESVVLSYFRGAAAAARSTLSSRPQPASHSPPSRPPPAPGNPRPGW
jgi:hypothetical protein